MNVVASAFVFFVSSVVNRLGRFGQMLIAKCHLPLF